MRGRLIPMLLLALGLFCAGAGQIPGTGLGARAYGAEADTIEVVATGIGKDSDSALRNALRAAVEQAVGTLLDSETQADNDEVISDRILSYSAGFVQSHKVIGEPRTRDGLVSLKISAVVKRTELTDKLKAASINVAAVDGESLFGEAVTKLEKNQSAAEMVRKALEGFPQNVLEIKGPDKDHKPRYDEQKKKLIVPVEVSINKDKYTLFANKLLNVLRKAASDTNRKTFKANMENHSNYNDKITFEKTTTWLEKYSTQAAIVICTQINDAMTNSIWEVFVVPDDIINIASLNEVAFSVDLMDRQNGSIDAIKRVIPFAIKDEYGNYNNKTNRWRFIYPLLEIQKINCYSADVLLVSAKGLGRNSVVYNLEFDVSPTEFKHLNNVICRID